MTLVDSKENIMKINGICGENDEKYSNKETICI